MSKVQPFVIDVNAAISACQKGGCQWRETLLFDNMLDVQVEPELFS